MNKIIWTEEYSVGNTTIDSQHQKIISLINQLIDHHTSSVSSEIITNILDDVIKYTHEHLEYEEVLLAELNYPEISQHKALHFNYLETISELMVEASNQIEAHNQNSMVPLKLLGFLIDWWNNHILQEDMQYKSFIAEEIK